MVHYRCEVCQEDRDDDPYEHFRVLHPREFEEAEVSAEARQAATVIWDVVDRRTGEAQLPDLFRTCDEAEAAIASQQAIVHSLPEADTVWAMSLETRLQGYRCDPSLESRHSPAPHDYKVIGTEYGSLGDGGSYEELRCRACGRVAYSTLPD